MSDSNSGVVFDSLSMRAKSLWAKASNDSDSEEWLPLAIHMSDASGVARLLWRNWLPCSVKETIIHGIDGCGAQFTMEQAENLYVFLAAAHDLGKAIPAFQGKRIFNNKELEYGLQARVRESGLNIRDDLTEPNKIHHSLASELILERNGFDSSLGVVLGGHHGKPPSYEDFETYGSYPHNTGFRDEHWVSVQDELLTYAADLSNIDIGGITQTAISVPAQFLFTGMVVMSDWIASDECLFPYVPSEYCMRCDEMVSRAEKAWSRLRLPPVWRADDSWRREDLYVGRFDFMPRPFQDVVRSVAEDMPSPGMMVVEAPMGEGKTEAALVAAEIMAEKFGCGGVFFALPTQATADGLFPRVRQWIDKTMEHDPDRHSIFLAHGKSAYNAEYKELRSTTRVSVDGLNDSDDRLVVHEWLQGRKKGILSEFVIGTVDQVLMGGLKQKHLCMRHLGLAGKVVIIDECHAYDAYMGSYLSKVIRWLGAYKVPVIILSATLPSGRRRELIDAYLDKKTGTDAQENIPEWVSNTAYPLITYSDGGEVRQRCSKISDRVSEIEIRRVDEDAVFELLEGLVGSGGYVGIILNTVKRAQLFAERLNEHYPNKVHLLHSRYISIDRTRREANVMRLLREDRRAPPHMEFIVGTQVMEQSLDLDFDLIVTDLCPMDLLIQRMGRLHRHENIRPEFLMKPICIVIDGGEDYEKGSEFVYGRYHLMNTRHLLPDKVCFPGDIPLLVQNAYSPNGAVGIPDVLREEYTSAMCEFMEGVKKKRRKASVFQIKDPGAGLRPVIKGWLENSKRDDELYAEAAVRDTNGSLEVILVQKRNGKFFVLDWVEKFGGQEIPCDSIPSLYMAFTIAGCRVPLPQKFAAHWNIDKTITELERIYTPPCWQESPWLRGELFLILDENFNVELMGESISYHESYGLLFGGEGG